ncbi:insertion element IS1 (fragment) [Xenorhabdus bovienii str. Intermedium]|uniref:Insertion element IS1 n=1 Tax=Xenorhabdus bovienii str. Intermedium TaxID=1379677 RepID=A0A077QIY3_XENBV
MAYTYQACKPGVKEQIIDMAMNNSGIRDTARVLKVATATVMKTLKNSTPGT